MLNDGSHFTWNARDEVATLNGVSLQYDAFERRIKNLAGMAFVYDGANAAQELSGSTVIASLLSGGVDEIFTRTDSSGTFMPLTDALGSTIALVDSSGNVQISYSYDPFGGTSVSGQGSSNMFQYTGRENDGNGLYYYRARYYSAPLGRFISEDPLGFDGDDVNFYAYDGNDPIDFVDPFGLKLIPKPGPGQQGQANLADYNTALDYLRHNPGMAQVIKTLEDSPQNFYVVFNNNKDDYYCATHAQACGPVHSVHWDRHIGLVCTNGGRITPALALGHELAHAAGDGKKARHLLTIPDPDFDNKEERRVQTTYEIPAATQFGEGIRWNHGGQSFYAAPNVTSQQGPIVPQ
jgi:RHS repeat-associated protein